ncbi:MAG: TonB-dependent receptor [Verrucomicrobiota bacterium]
MTRNQNLHLLLLSACCVCAHGQNQSEEEPVEEIISLEQFTIQGSKTDTTRQALSTSLGYFSSERLLNEPIFTVDDVFDRTANAFTGTTSFGAYSIRGVNNNGIAGAINSSNALASIIVNQVALGVNTGDYLKPSLFDAQSVEILRGPQSAIQGPNSLIGAIFINYNRPEFGNNEGRFRAEYGEDDTYNLGIVQNIGLVDDTLAIRVVAETRQSEGDIVNTTTGSEDVQRIDEENLRLMLRYSPFEDDKLLVDASYLHTDSDSNPFALAVAPSGGDIFDRQQPYSVDDSYPFTFDQFDLEAELELSENWKLSSVTGYTDFEVEQGFDGDLSAFDFLAVEGLIAEELLSQEIRVNYSGDKISALAGFFYSDGDYQNGFSGSGLFPDPFGNLAPFNTISRNDENIEQIALFGQLSYDFTDRLNLTVGLRANEETRTVKNFADNNGFISDLEADETFDQIIPSASIAYEINELTTIGVKYGRGVQAGGIAFAVFLGQSAPYEEEFIDNYEVFLRYHTADGRFIFNLNAYYTDWTDQQVTTTIPGGFPGFDDLVVNAGESSLYGVETEVEWRLGENLGTFLSFGYNTTEFEEFVLNGVDLSGQRFPQSPEYNFAIGFNYAPENGLFASGTFSYVDSAFTDIAAPNLTTVSSRELLSGRLGYSKDWWKIYIWGTNLLDDEYELGLFDGTAFGLGGAYGRPGNPRTLGVGMDLNW